MKFADSITSDRFREALSELKTYDALTIGPADEHTKDIMDVVRFGGSCLMVVFQGERGVDSAQQINANQLTLIEEEV